MPASSVDVFIPVYNDVDHIAEAVQSALDQQDVDVRVLVSDNHSTDGSWEVLQSLAAKEPRLELHRNPENIGMAANMARLQDLVERPFYMFLCSDDRLSDPRAFIDALTLMQDNPKIVSVYSDLEFIDEEGHRIALNRFDRASVFDTGKALRQSVISTRNKFGIPVLHRSEFGLKYGYPAHLRYAMDVWHSAKAGAHGKCGHIPRPCIGNRYTGQNLSAGLFSGALSEMQALARETHIKLSLKDTLMQRLNCLKTACAKWVFFRCVLPYRKWARQ